MILYIYIYIYILEALVEKRTIHFSQTEHNVQKAIAEMESAKQSLMVAQQQLLDVRGQKAAEDARAASENAEQQASQYDRMKEILVMNQRENQELKVVLLLISSLPLTRVFHSL